MEEQTMKKLISKLVLICIAICTFCMLSMYNCKNAIATTANTSIDESIKSSTADADNSNIVEDSELSVGGSIEFGSTNVNDEYLIIESPVVLPTMSSDINYSKAYAQALVQMGPIPYPPTGESMIAMENVEDLAVYEPRFVFDHNGKLHTIWTNDQYFLVVDTKETKIKVSDCIFCDILPELPESLKALKKHYATNEQFRLGIAEDTFLEELSDKIGCDVLYKVRFYNYNGTAVAVYSLTENGELYINEMMAESLLE